MRYEILRWDTSFFGFSVAKILPSNLSYESLSSILSDIRTNGVRLVYWASHKILPEEKIKCLGGLIVDKKTTYEIDLQSTCSDHSVSLPCIEQYISAMPILDMEILALESGKYSRFFVDPHFDSDKSKELFKRWIRDSINKKIADEVLVIRNDEKIVGMVTLACNKDYGTIGLLAVDSSFRGRGYGRTLVKSAQAKFIGGELNVGRVVTQGDNIPACRLYERCGYHIYKTEYYYHFWM